MPLPPYTHFLFFSCILSILYVLLLTFPSLPSDTGFISTWETRLRARTCLMEPLVPCVCWGIALVPDCEGQWFSLLAQPGFASPVLIYMNSFASPLIWKWDQVLNFIYFSGMLNNKQWLFFFFEGVSFSRLNADPTCIPWGLSKKITLGSAVSECCL